MKDTVQSTINPGLESLHHIPNQDENNSKQLENGEARTADLEMAVLLQVRTSFSAPSFYTVILKFTT